MESVEVNECRHTHLLSSFSQVDLDSVSVECFRRKQMPPVKMNHTGKWLSNWWYDTAKKRFTRWTASLINAPCQHRNNKKTMLRKRTFFLQSRTPVSGQPACNFYTTTKSNQKLSGSVTESPPFHSFPSLAPSQSSVPVADTDSISAATTRHSASPSRRWGGEN